MPELLVLSRLPDIRLRVVEVTHMPTSILRPEAPEDVARADELVVDLDRWRTAVEIVQKLRETGIKCRVSLVPAKRRD
jgi:hypothetical protein